MGFGLLFLGYVTLVFLKIVPVGLLGAYLMYRGLVKLCPYGENFVKARKMSEVFFIYFAIYTAFWTANTFGFSSLLQNELFVLFDTIVYYGVFCVFSTYLIRALADISEQTGYQKGKRKATVCINAVYVLVLVVVVKTVLSVFNLSGYMTLPALLYEFVLLIVNSEFIYSCYMMIATEEIINEENKKMREYDEKYSMLKKKKEKSSFSVKKKR